MRLFSGLMLCLLVVLPPAAGCSPAVPREELGTVLEELPAVPGTDEPYEMPDLGPPTFGGEGTREADAGI